MHVHGFIKHVDVYDLRWKLLILALLPPPHPWYNIGFNFRSGGTGKGALRGTWMFSGVLVVGTRSKIRVTIFKTNLAAADSRCLLCPVAAAEAAAAAVSETRYDSPCVYVFIVFGFFFDDDEDVVCCLVTES